METQYWAMTGPDRIAKEVMARVDSYKQYMDRSGMLAELRKSYSQFFVNTEIQDVDQSLKAININHYGSYVRNIHNMVTSSRPAWETQAINSDVETQTDTKLAAGLLDFYMRDKHIETKLTDACLKALFLREGWISLGWDATGGEVYGTNPETGEPIHEGDFKIGTHTILDVIRDIRKRDMNHQWYIVREYENKWDLAANHRELAEKIIALGPDNRFDVQYELNGSENINKMQDANSDLIPTYTLFHARTPACKSGRMVKVLSDEIVTFDGPLPYKNIYLFPITSGQHFENAFGHSYLMDLLPINDAFNMSVSSALTNIAANAVQNFQVPKGAAPNLLSIASGMNLWEYDPKAGKIERMDLLGTAPEVYQFSSFLIQQGDLVSNVGQVGRGETPTQMSGTAMALLQQQAIMSTSGVQTSFTIAQENVGTGLIELLQTFAVVPRVAMIVGKSKRSELKTFTNKDLKGINKVRVNRANPLMKTGAGRLEVANNLLATPNMIKTPEQYLGVLTTGNLEPLYQHDESSRIYMMLENEGLMDGVPQQALLTDDHPMHILEHSCVLNSPETRQNPQIVQAVLAHIQEHLDLGKSMDPMLANSLKQVSMFQPPPPPPMPGGPAPEGMPIPPAGGVPPEVSLPSPAQPPNPNAFNEGVQ